MKRKHVLLLAVLMAFVAVNVGSPATAAVNDGAAKKSLFVQLSTTSSTSTLSTQLSHVCSGHKDPAKDDYIYNLVLQDVGTYNSTYNRSTSRNQISSTLMTAKLNAIKGSLGCFDNIFVGTVDVPWPTSLGGSKYQAGINDSTFRWENLDESKAIAAAFDSWWATNMGSAPYHWYITYEANLNDFTNSTIRSNYEAYLIQHVKDLRAVPGQSSAAMMWSPAFWNRYAANATLQSNLSTMFTNVKSLSASSGITWLDLQDRIGATWCYPSSSKVTTADARNWYLFLDGMAYNFASLRINMEQYKYNCSTGALIPLTTAEKATIENYYESNGVPIGASWEIRFWYGNHTEL